MAISVYSNKKIKDYKVKFKKHHYNKHHRGYNSTFSKKRNTDKSYLGTNKVTILFSALTHIIHKPTFAP